MKFFVDYENVHALGFRGAEFLRPDDEVVLFYSPVCANIERGILNKLYESGCFFRIFKIARIGRNALDFYITSHIGETLGRDFTGAVGIVSHDKGFRAIHDYWLVRNPKMKIICKSDIAQCIQASNENNNLRWREACLEYGALDLEEQYPRFARRLKLRCELEQALISSGREWSFDDLAKGLAEQPAGREMYLSLMREYGIKDGLAVYQAVKRAFGSLQEGAG